MAFITHANAQNIVRKIKLSSLGLKGAIYKRPIFFFSKYEKNSLLAIQELLNDPEHFFNEIYNPLEITDTFTYVYEGKKPAYHKSFDCELLKSDYQNFEIPEEIKNKGKNEIIKFRKWFKHNEYLLDKPDVFVMRLKLKFGIETNPNAISYTNSGSSEIKNYNLVEIEKMIDYLIKKAGRYYYASNKNTTILRSYSKITFLAYNEKPIYDNKTGFEDKVIKEFLREYDKMFKKPLKKLLIEYYRLKLNPKIKLEGSLLDQLNFRPCSKCHNTNSYIDKF